MSQYNNDKVKDFAQKVTDKLVEQLEKGVAPWQKPWQEASGILPKNATTGKRYNGINVIHLMSERITNDFNDNRWLTYKQAKSLGAHVRKGEKGTIIQHWAFTEEVDKLDKEGKQVLDEKGLRVKETVNLEKPIVTFHTVFNADQIDNMPPINIDQKANHEWERVERAEKILQNSGATIQHQEGGGAYYSPSRDSITLPAKAQFPTADNYYATALHELGHWTGHKDRLNRDLSGKFGSESYAKEELRAEISSMILGEELGIGHDTNQHAAYVKSWIKVLKEDPYEIFRAARDAEKIYNHVMKFDEKIQVKETLQNDIKVNSAEVTPKNKEEIKETPAVKAKVTVRKTKKVTEDDKSQLANSVKSAAEKFATKVKKIKEKKEKVAVKNKITY